MWNSYIIIIVSDAQFVLLYCTPYKADPTLVTSFQDSIVSWLWMLRFNFFFLFSQLWAPGSPTRDVLRFLSCGISCLSNKHHVRILYKQFYRHSHFYVSFYGYYRVFLFFKVLSSAYKIVSLNETSYVDS